MTAGPQATKDFLRTELEATRSNFHALLDSLSEKGLHTQSLNPGWTNGEILTHIAFGFVIITILLPMARLWGRLPKGSSKPFAWLLNALTGPFNWVNALGARMQGGGLHAQADRRTVRPCLLLTFETGRCHKRR